MGQAAGREGARPRGTCARAAWAGGTRRPRNFVRAGPGSGTRELRGDGAGAPPRAPRGLCVRPRGQLPSRARRPLRSARAARDAPARPRGGAEPRTGAGCERGAGGPGGFGRSGGPAAMFLRGGLRAPRAGGGGTWRRLRAAADCSRLRPRAACGERPVRPPPSPGAWPGGARDTKDGRRVRSLATLGPPRRRSPRSRPETGGGWGGGESPRPAQRGPALTCRPLAAARGTHKGRLPPCATCAAGPGSMSVAGTWQDPVFPSGFLLISWRGGEKTGERSRARGS